MYEVIQGALYSPDCFALLCFVPRNSSQLLATLCKDGESRNDDEK
jgi:hypothetical protein